ncbi:MAG: hypothetical protein IT430_17115 [Phycisphaerales bacterium]|nr:hypothetical protein [Phycisphaerales bacterium]
MSATSRLSALRTGVWITIGALLALLLSILGYGVWVGAKYDRPLYIQVLSDHSHRIQGPPIDLEGESDSRIRAVRMVYEGSLPMLNDLDQALEAHPSASARARGKVQAVRDLAARVVSLTEPIVKDRTLVESLDWDEFLAELIRLRDEIDDRMITLPE